MTRSEYEARRRALEEQLRADIALIQAAHETRLRSLERLWQAANEAEEPNPGPSQAAERPARAETTPAAVPVPPAAEPKPPARPRGQVLADLLDILPELPEVFERPDIIKALGYEPSRSSLHRALAKLLEAGEIVVESRSDGGILASYRRVGEGGAE